MSRTTSEDQLASEKKCGHLGARSSFPLAALDDDQIAKFQRELGAMGYRFQFVTLAGFHSLNHGMFDLARGYAEHGIAGYVDLQEREFTATVARFHCRQAPARGRDRLLRPRFHRREPRLLDHRARRLHGGTAVPPGLGSSPWAGTPLSVPALAPLPRPGEPEVHQRTDTPRPSPRGTRRSPRGDPDPALDFVGRLAAAFGGRRQDLLKERKRQAIRLAAGSPLGFPLATASVRSDRSWRVAPPGPGLPGGLVPASRAASGRPTD